MVHRRLAAKAWTGAGVLALGLAIPATGIRAQVQPDTLVVSLSIGEFSGAEEYLFTSVQGVQPLSDGSIAVADRSRSALRLFDASGTFQRALAIRGRGPGEIGGASALAVSASDSIYVADYENVRINVYTAASGFVRSFQVDGFFSEESGLAFAGDHLVKRRPAPFEGVDVVTWLSVDGTVVAETPLDFMRPDIGVPGAPRAPLLSDYPLWAGLPEGVLVVAYSHGNSLTGLTVEGDTLWTLPVATDVRGPTDQRERDALAELWRERLTLGGIPRSMWDRIILTFPERWPRISHVLQGPGGVLWVQEAAGVDDMRPEHLDPSSGSFRMGAPRWERISPETGRSLGRVVAPMALRLHSTLANDLYGVTYDDFGVERVARVSTGPRR